MTRLERLRQTGIRRLGNPKSGFRYEHSDGVPASRGDLDRIRSLRLPPAWSDVSIDRSSRAALQAVGKDAAGRWQYRYHDSHVQKRERQKLSRLIAFLEALPKLRTAIALDLALPGLPREKVFAVIVRIMATRFLRPGSRQYAEENDSYGLVTLRMKHATFKRGAVHLSFRGKSKKMHDVELSNPGVRRVVRSCSRLPGRQLFQYVDQSGGAVPVTRRALNLYIKEIMGQRFSAKDFRTWAGTLICANLLARETSLPETRKGRRRAITGAVKETARRLGNTPAVCRTSYIAPAVLTGFERSGAALGASIESIVGLVDRRTLHRSERELLKLLKRNVA